MLTLSNFRNSAPSPSFLPQYFGIFKFVFLCLQNLESKLEEQMELTQVKEDKIHELEMEIARLESVS